MAIEVTALRKEIDKQQILKEVSFSFESGIIALLGPNGAGKSTLMKILTTYLKPSGGSAHICGFDVGKNPQQVKKVIGYLPENNPLYLDLFVKEYLCFLADLHKVDRSRVDQIISETALGDEQHKKIKYLSKGYRQRVGLAQAMLHNPKVLILDEPTTGLDPNQIIEIRQLIKQFSQHRTVLISTHIMQEVEAICDQVLMLHKGTLLLNESTQNILNIYGKVEDAFYKLTTDESQ